MSKESAVYGGGGFLYDTSLDGADSISLGSALSKGSLVHGNGGADTLYVAGNVLGSTVYGGQGADSIQGAGVASTSSMSGSLIEGNRGNDKIIFASTQSIFNSKVYGSDATGTLAGNDSIVLAGNTVQTSTVYGGAGSDTLIIGNYSSAADAQLLKIDVQGFAGDDSIQFGGSFVSSTLTAGAGNDTLDIAATTGTSASSATEFYAGTGSDSVNVSSGQNLTIYGDSSASDTAGGADSSKSLVSPHRPFMALQVATL